ncbi:helix-turn-helix domain-containing protein [Enterobacter asburiae]|uniref:helix-turn-helix domain-containing protein n=1 Tax=Enterobacter asburiae TaxID=61645 RepID=UPI002FF71626
MLTEVLRNAIRQRPARRYEKKQFLWREGDRYSGLWLIKAGAVKTVCLTPKGDEQITGFYLPGEYPGIDDLPGGIHRGYAQVIDDCAVHLLSPLQLEAHMDASDVRREVYRLMSERLRQNQRRLYELSRMSAGARLAGFIYDIASRYGLEGDVLRDFRLPMLRCDIANYTGLATETVTREMLKMVEAGAFRFSRRYISGLHPEMMNKLTRVGGIFSR